MPVAAGGLFGAYRPVPLDDAGAPPFPSYEADEDEASQHDGIELDYERPSHDWRPLPPGDPPADAPVRFIDGSITTRTAAAITVEGRTRPLIAAAISAAALEMRGRLLTRGDSGRIRKLLCMYAHGIDPAALAEARQLLRPAGVQLETRDAEVTRDFDAMRRATRGIGMEAMELEEKAVLFASPHTPTLVDGLLERRLAASPDHAIPAVGLVKRQITTYLPGALQEIVYQLHPGERTPAFVLRTVQHVDLVNFYLRLSAPAGISPSYGVVRVTAPLAYVVKAHPGGEMPRYLSGLAAYLYRLRHRDYGYARAGISVEPIVRVEDHLHAILPSVELLVAKVHALFGARRAAAAG